MTKVISIVTDWREGLGSGHIQRMMNLAAFINSRGDYKAYIINIKKPVNSSRDFTDIILDKIHPETSLIIRDMRDSLKFQIVELKKKSPVLVIDDFGHGAEYADFKINLLPDPATNSHELKKFLYGYNFSESIRALTGEKIYSKDIDIAFYTGYKPEEKYISDIIELFPENSTAAVLSGEKSFFFINRIKKDFNIKYSEALLRSKVLLSHFGLTIYEGFACGAVPMTVNPTEYHKALTGIVKDELGIIDLGLLNKLDKSRAQEIINNSLSDIKLKKTTPNAVLNTIESATNEFYKYLLNLIF